MIEKLKKQAAQVQQRISELTTRQGEAATRVREIEERRQSFLAQAGEGNSAARKELQRLDGDKQNAATDHEAFSAAMVKANRELASIQEQLVRGEREAAIVGLENEITALGQAGGKVEQAIGGVRIASADLYSGAARVAGQLAAIDPEQFGPSFASEIQRDITTSITRQLNMIGTPPGWPTPPSIFELIGGRLRSTVQQLRFEGGEFQVAGKGEKLFRAAHRVGGLRGGVDLKPGQVIALTPAEAKPLLSGGALEPVSERDEVAAPPQPEVPAEPERPQRGERILNAGGF